MRGKGPRQHDRFVCVCASGCSQCLNDGGMLSTPSLGPGMIPINLVNRPCPRQYAGIPNGRMTINPTPHTLFLKTWMPSQPISRMHRFLRRNSGSTSFNSSSSSSSNSSPFNILFISFTRFPPQMSSCDRASRRDRKCGKSMVANHSYSFFDSKIIKIFRWNESAFCITTVQETPLTASAPVPRDVTTYVIFVIWPFILFNLLPTSMILRTKMYLRIM
mmetsp:Transcript_10884/g.45316  ORF Transcript_10884/g.45316 Transcript_10884/m.45316 type:complete len:218 (+) Transcript_10884:1120-1773(+)